MNALAPTRVWGSANEIAEALIPGFPGTKKGVAKHIAKFAENQKLESRRRKGRGGGIEFSILDLKLNEVQWEAWDAYCLCEAEELPAAPADQKADAVTSISARAPEGAMPSQLVGGAAGAIVAPERAIALPGTSEYEAVRVEIWRQFDAKRQRIKDDAVNRASAVISAIDHIKSGLPIMESYRRAAAEFSVSPDSAESWVKKIGGYKNPKYDRSDFAAALIDGRGGRPRPHAYDEPLYENYSSDYLRTDHPPRMACYRRAVLAAKNRGVPDDRIPTEPTLWRRLEKEVPWQSRLYARKGEQALHRTYPAQRRDRSGLYAGQAVNGDGYRWNLAALWPDGEICRPLMWYWKDEFSGKILAWRVDRTENWGLIRLAIGDLIRDVCIPEWFTIDNTMAAAAKQITGGSRKRYRYSIREEDPLGLIPLLGSRVANTLPVVGGSSKSGERGGGDWDRDIARHPALEGAWLGHNTATRPEAARRIIPIEELIPIIREGLNEHNTRPGRDTQNCEGRFSFDQVFAESYPKHAHRKPTPEQLRLCMLAAENVTCRKIDGAVELYKNIFWSHVTSKLAGKRIVARFDPNALHQSIFIYSLDGKFIGEAECRLPEGFHDVDAARTHNRLRRQSLRLHKEIARNARTMTALELAAQLPTSPDPEPISTKVVRLIRPSIEAPHTIDLDEDRPDPSERAWREYCAWKRLPIESLTKDEIARMRMYEGSAAYRARQVLDDLGEVG